MKSPLNVRGNGISSASRLIRQMRAVCLTQKVKHPWVKPVVLCASGKVLVGKAAWKQRFSSKWLICALIWLLKYQTQDFTSVCLNDLNLLALCVKAVVTLHKTTYMKLRIFYLSAFISVLEALNCITGLYQCTKWVRGHDIPVNYIHPYWTNSAQCQHSGQIQEVICPLYCKSERKVKVWRSLRWAAL